jgi:hypothetical protein
MLFGQSDRGHDVLDTRRAQIDDLTGHSDGKVCQIVAPGVGYQSSFDQIGAFKSEVNDATAFLGHEAAPIGS